MVRLDILKPETYDLILSSPDSQSPEKLRVWAGEQYEYPLTFEQLNKILSVSKEGNTHFYQIEVADRVVGMVVLSIYGGQRASLGEMLIFSETDRHKGYASMAIKYLKIIAQNDYKIKTMFLKVFRDNLSAINCYKKAGFEFIVKDELEPIAGRTIVDQYYMMCRL